MNLLFMLAYAFFQKALSLISTRSRYLYIKVPLKLYPPTFPNILHSVIVLITVRLNITFSGVCKNAYNIPVKNQRFVSRETQVDLCLCYLLSVTLDKLLKIILHGFPHLL